MSLDDLDLYAARLRVLDIMKQQADCLISARGQFRTKPIVGGVFGTGHLKLASLAYTARGLDMVRYYVLDEESWLFLGIGDTKSECIEDARRQIKLLGLPLVAHYLRDLAATRLAQARDEREDAGRAEEIVAKSADVVQINKAVPKRRRQIFEASEGKCHYCSTPLTLDGKWHVEHRMPKALQGDNAPSNLVASCTACNFDKRDLTDQEYLAKRARRNKVKA
jgi:5-methylcytosine-specific restriction endonuclease McrA